MVGPWFEITTYLQSSHTNNLIDVIEEIGQNIKN